MEGISVSMTVLKTAATDDDAVLSLPPGSSCLPRPPKALVFEMANVLHDATSWHRWLWQLLGRFGVTRDYASFYRVWRQDYLRHVHCGERTFADAFSAFLVELGISRGRIAEIAAASTARRRMLSDAIRPLPGVAKTLARLAASGITMGISADCELTGEELRQRIDRIRLAPRFRCLLSSRDLGRTKPDPASYHAAVSALQVAPADVAFVGSSAEDLAGAAAAGLRTIAVNFEPHVTADVCLRHFDDLVSTCTPSLAALAS